MKEREKKERKPLPCRLCVYRPGFFFPFPLLPPLHGRFGGGSLRKQGHSRSGSGFTESDLGKLITGYNNKNVGIVSLERRVSWWFVDIRMYGINFWISMVRNVITVRANAKSCSKYGQHHQLKLFTFVICMCSHEWMMFGAFNNRPNNQAFSLLLFLYTCIYVCIYMKKKQCHTHTR